MNTLRILRGSDITICVDDVVLCFVTDFVAKESRDVYKIEEFLSDEEFDTVPLKDSYVLSITALSHLDSSVFDKDGFTITVDDSSTIYEYTNCRLKEKKRDIASSKHIVDKYTIVASKMRVLEGLRD